MFTKTILGFAIVAASVRASRGNVSASALNTSYTFGHQNGTQPTAFNAPNGLEEATTSRRLSEKIKIHSYQDGTALYALCLLFEEASPTILMLNDNTILSSRATVEIYEQQLKGYEQQAVDLRNTFNVNVLMVYYRGYVMYMKKIYREIMNDS